MVEPLTLQHWEGGQRQTLAPILQRQDIRIITESVDTNLLDSSISTFSVEFLHIYIKTERKIFRTQFNSSAARITSCRNYNVYLIINS